MPQSKNHSRNKTGITKQPPLLDFFPEIEPYSSGYMAVDKPHEIYWEQCGNPDGIPLVFFHGGPGSGCIPKQRQFYDPDHYRIILFDQRGAGRSMPPACLENNTTEYLIRDIEQLRKHLNIDKWHIFGGSWGSTLALSYAAEHADRCISLTIRGIFLMEAADIEWFMYTNKNIFPEAWEQFTSVIPKDEHDDLLEAYYKRLTGDDKELQLDCAINWYIYESACSSLVPNHQMITTDEQKERARAVAVIECHYFRNQMIKPEDSLINKVDKFRHVPATIIQGRYDMICPIASAHKLHAAWPEADYIIIPDAGHTAMDPPLRSRLIEIAEHLKSIK